MSEALVKSVISILGVLGVMVLFCLPAEGLDINVLILKEIKENGSRLSLKNSGMIHDEGAV